MIRGEVDADHQAVILLPVRAVDGRIEEFRVIIDTGFSGYLTLSPQRIATLGLPFQQRLTFTLGDNSQADFDVYLATVIWDGIDRDISVLSAEGEPLLGMSMLRGYEVFMDVVDGGEVRVEARA